MLVWAKCKYFLWKWLLEKLGPVRAIGPPGKGLGRTKPGRHSTQYLQGLLVNVDSVSVGSSEETVTHIVPSMLSHTPLSSADTHTASYANNWGFFVGYDEPKH
jgi:hypothetical protein